MTTDRYNLQRFVDAQRPVYADALEELRTGRKRSHWMWFIFPQIAGLGYSATAQHFAISGLEEARAYLAHPVLGLRLRECAELVCAVQGSTAGEIFGSPDDLKFRSSMTLFAEAAPDDDVFRRALERFFDGRPDPRTVELVAKIALYFGTKP